jgi:16S rRNA processing protein RimM
VACIAGIGDRTEAEALKGTRLYVPRQALPPPGEDEYYHADLIGLAVRFVAAPDEGPGPAEPPLATGMVTAVHDHGGGAILEVVPDGGHAPLLVPFSRAAVPEIDLDRRRLVVVLLPGLVAAADEAAPGDAAGHRP